MRYDGHTRTCGLIGNPVEHTMSPLIQNFMAEQTGKNMVYVPFHVQQGMLEHAVKGAFALNLLGCNVTVPYKSDVLEYLVDIDPLAKRIGAVNTLVRVENGYKGYNTDMPGLYRAMCHDGVDITGKEVVILGAGGVARAVAVMLLDKGAGGVILFNRTAEKAQQIADEVNGYAGAEFARAYALAEYEQVLTEKKYIVIQATSVGMHPDVENVIIRDEAFYDKVEVGYDLIFNPSNTKFMQLTTAHGGKAYNGAKMLVYQGVIAFELWNDIRISRETAEGCIRQMEEAMK
ncbi:MAG: shikimate dehydrogenase [Lachnospiraceae bacterium]|nr:shikimate dehydrogenase [Lachnospiraceae bacterium]